jgi:alkylation response protein AidB-like acyl-CoA dehydrogenase
MDFILEVTEPLLRSAVAPHANEMDSTPERLQAALSELGNHALLGLRIPQAWNGREAEAKTFQAFQEMVARYSGALAFLQAQHQSAGSMLVRSENESLKQTYLPDMSTGKALVGISFAHLRRENPPVKAIAVSDGYQIHGVAPWVTGWGFFQTFIVAAVLPDGQAVYGIVPFQTTQQATAGRIICHSPMALAAMTATNTVAVEFEEWFLPQTQVVRITPMETIARNDRLNVLQHSFFALGCARAALDILQTAHQRKNLPFIHSAYDALVQELAECRQAIYSAQPGVESFAAKLQLRAWAIELAVRCAHAAITASSGAANVSSHAAQRVYREALVFSVSGQTTALMEATLARLVKRLSSSSAQMMDEYCFLERGENGKSIEPDTSKS